MTTAIPAPETLHIELRDEDLEPLRRFLSDEEGWWVPFETLPSDERVRAERAMFQAAFELLVKRRFGASFSRGEIIRFVADLRIALGEDARELSPRSAELVIRAALDDVGKEEAFAADRNPEAEVNALLFVLGRLNEEYPIGENALGDLLREVKNYAQQMLRYQRAAVARAEL